MVKSPLFAVSKSRFDDNEMLSAEMQEVGKLRPDVGNLLNNLGSRRTEGPYAIGLALSGGGIRSATVSLGILQKLAGTGLLKHVDYLSTVSGGGYIGSALTWWLRGPFRTRKVNDETGNAKDVTFNTEDVFPFGTIDPADPEERSTWAAPLHYLRTQGNYLMPSRYITIWSGLAILLRAIALNLVVWIPITALVMLLLLWLGYFPAFRGLPFMLRMLAPEALTGLADAVGSRQEVEVNQTVPAFFLFLLFAAGLLFLLFIIGSLGHSLLSWTGQPPGTRPEVSNANDAAAMEKTSVRSNWWSWPSVMLAGVLSLVLAAVIVWWMHPIIEPLFANRRDVLDLYLTPVLTNERIVYGLFIVESVMFATFFLLWRTSRRQDRQWFPLYTQYLLAAMPAFLLGILALAWILACLGWPQLSRALQLLFATGALVLGFYLVAMLVRYFLRREQIGDEPGPANGEMPSINYLHYNARRLFERNFGFALMLSVILVVVGSLPLVHSFIGYKLGGTGTALGLLFAAGGNIWGRISGHGRWTSFFIVLGAILICYGVLLVGYSLAEDAIKETATANQRALLAMAMLIAVIMGWFVNTNHIGLHRFYRDRLMEAFMPDYRLEWSAAEGGGFENRPARGANDFPIAAAWQLSVKDNLASGPYHIVNTNLVLPNSLERHYRLRGGDNFILSPIFSGSSATDWHRTDQTDFHDMSLASAMAISGAAANPRGGAGGRGLTRNAAVSLVMSLLNVRLGYWIPNPRDKRKWFTPKRPNHFWPGGLYALGNAMGKGYREDSKWIELADGGHFENLAIYELVRRRCGLIIVCDGGQDNASSYADLVTAIQRVGEDFGARIHFDMQIKNGAGGKPEISSPAQLIAKSSNTDYPKSAEFAERGYFVCRIDYGTRGKDGWPKQGIIIYLKSALIKKLDARAKGYAGANPEFPNQSTGDQFFDEEQFEAYREVGYRICEQMIDDLWFDQLFKDGARPTLRKLRSNGRYWPKNPEAFDC
jgi:hypothetical protein